MKRIKRLTENDLHRIIENTIDEVLNEDSDYVLLKGRFGVATYLELFDEYVLDYGNEVYFSERDNRYTHFGNQGWEKKKFENYDELKSFCAKNRIKIVDTCKIGHSLAKGLPDCRSISDDMAKRL